MGLNKIRKILGIIILSIASFILVGGGILVIGSPRSIDNTIKHNRKIEHSFIQASSFVDDFFSEHGRHPTKKEFKEWSESFPSRPYTPKRISIEYLDFPIEVIEKFGQPNEDAYLLSYWRGEWFEYYASWVKGSTLEFDPRKYYAFGSWIIDTLVLLIICGLLFLLAWLLLRQTSNRNHTSNR